MSVSTESTALYLLEDLKEARRASELADGDLAALRSVADWIESFIVRPHPDLGRPGTVCPFVPGSLERKVLWLAPEKAGDRSASELTELMNAYKSRLLSIAPADGDDRTFRTIIVIFPDLSPDRAGDLFGQVLEPIAVPSYIEDGILFGPFYTGNEDTAIYNKDFRPFQSPVPFIFVRHTVVSDWKFFLADEDGFSRWAHRFGESGAHELAKELRRLPWASRRD